jgi:hypothetical protein
MVFSFSLVIDNARQATRRTWPRERIQGLRRYDPRLKPFSGWQLPGLSGRLALTGRPLGFFSA